VPKTPAIKKGEISMTDKQGWILFIGVVYSALTLLSIAILTEVPEELERNKWLINKKWKRALWVMSCLLLLPLLIIGSKAPRFIFEIIMDFIMGENINDGEKDDAQNE
jgi:hypothetical protein